MWVYNKKSEKVFSAKPDKIGFKKHYHTFKKIDGTKDTNSIEDYLAEEWRAQLPKLLVQSGTKTFPKEKIVSFFPAFWAYACA